MPGTVRKSVSWIPTTAAFVALLSVGSGGCDWFGDPVQANLDPETVMETCPSSRHGIVAGDDVLVEWRGDDDDGVVVRYEWTYDDGALTGETEETSLVIENVSRGEHLFEVAAVDDEGDCDPTPATCEFVVELVPGVVLAEFITGRGCPNCPNARDGLYIMLREYGLDDLCVVSYHDVPHSLSTPETDARIEWYTGSPDVPPMPIVVFDGDWNDRVEGAADSTSAAAVYRQRIDEKRLVGSPLSLRVGGAVSRGAVTAAVKVRRDLTGGPHVLRAVVVEDDVFADLETHIYATRDILEDEVLAVAAAGDSVFVEKSFTIEPAWDIDNLDVLVFVQDDATKEVLQSGRLKTR